MKEDEANGIFGFFEVSAKSNTNVNECFEALVTDCMSEIEKR